MTLDPPDARPVLSPPGAGRSRASLALALLLPLLFACASRDLWAPDEPRYGLVGRTMLETGDFLVPRLNGVPYAEKPPLVFATIGALGSLVGDVTAVVARLACALFAAGAVLLTHRLARRWFRDAALADTAALLFSTTGLVLWNSGRAALDLPMTFFALLALEAGAALVQRPSSRAALGMGLALGAGLLVKGPHVLYVPVAAVVGGALFAGQGRRLRDPRWLLVLPVALAVAALWFFPAAAAAGDEVAHNSEGSFRQRILGQLGSRARGEDEPHAHGPLYLWPLLLAFGLPWVPLALVGLVGALSRRASRPSAPIAPAERFGVGAAAWGLLAPLVALSIPTSKRELYLLPLLPCAALLAAYVLHRRAGPAVERHTHRGLLGLLAALGVAALLAPLVSSFAPEVVAEGAAVLREPLVVAALLGCAAVCGAGALAVRRLRDRPVGAARVAGVSLGAAALVLTLAVLPAFDRFKTFEAPARAAHDARPGAPLAIWGFSDPSVAWWFRRERVARLGVHTFAEAADALRAGAPPTLVLAKTKTFAGRARRAAPEARAALDAARVVWEGQVGGTGYVVLTNPDR